MPKKPLFKAKKQTKPARATRAKKVKTAKRRIVKKSAKAQKRQIKSVRKTTKALPSKKKHPVVFTEERVAKLIEKAKPRGFITHSEILYQFPNI